MDGIFAVGCLSAASAFGLGALGYAGAVARQGARPTASVVVNESVRFRRLAVLLRHGVAQMKPLCRVLLGNEQVALLVREGVLLCGRRGYATADQAFLSVVLTGLALLALAAFVLTRSFVAGFVVPLCVVVLAAMSLRSARDAREEKVRESIPEILRSMEACFQTGYTLMQTFNQIAGEASGPLKKAFSQAAHLLEAGRPASEALSVIRDTTSVSELSFVAVALQVQHESGGSMRQVLASARDTVEGELELKRSLRVHTAQAKLSARIVSAMPVVLVALFSVISEGFLEPFFASPVGLALLALALAMQVAGIAAVRRTLSMEIAL